MHIDDILVTGTMEEEHVQALAQVLSCLEKAGLQVHKSEYKFFSP